MNQLKEAEPPEFTPLPDSMSPDDIVTPGDVNQYAYKTMSDPDALAAIHKVFGIQIQPEETQIVHSVSSRTIYPEFGMRLEPRRAATILDDVQRGFLKQQSLPGSKFGEWTVWERSKPWGERKYPSMPRVYDGLEFGKYDYVLLAHPNYTLSSEKSAFKRNTAVYAAVDTEDGDFYLTIWDWGAD